MWLPKGDVHFAPPHYPGSADHPSGTVPGLKVVGTFQAPPTPVGAAWEQAQLTAKLTKRLTDDREPHLHRSPA